MSNKLVTTKELAASFLEFLNDSLSADYVITETSVQDEVMIESKVD